MTKYYHMVEKSDADFSPNYRSCLLGKCTNGNIIVAGYKYSDDGGATWKSSTGSTSAGECIYVDGNNVYKVLHTDTYVFQVWLSSDSGASFSQLGDDIVDAAPPHDHPATLHPVGICVDDGTVRFIYCLTKADGSIYFIAMHKGVPSGWIEDKYHSYGLNQKTPIRRLWPGASGEVYFVLQSDSSGGISSTYNYVRLIKYTQSTTTFTGFNVGLYFNTDSPATTDDRIFRIDYSTGDFAYNSLDDFVQLSPNTEHFALSGYQTDDDDDGGTPLSHHLITNDGSWNTGWRVRSADGIVPAVGASGRVWGIVKAADDIYLSINNGEQWFVAAIDAVSATGTAVDSSWEGILEATASLHGVGAFDNGKFYTMQLSDLESIECTVRQESTLTPHQCQLEYTVDVGDINYFMLTTSTGSPLFTGWGDIERQSTDNPYKLKLTGAEVGDLDRRIYQTCTSQNCASMLSTLLGDNAFFLREGTFSSGSTTYSATFKGESLADILLWMEYQEGLAIYWNAEGVVTMDAGITDSTTNLTETEIVDCTKVKMAIPRRVEITGGMLNGNTLRVNKNVDNYIAQTNWTTYQAAFPWVAASATLETLAGAIEDMFVANMHFLELTALQSSIPQAGQTYGITYNISPVSVASETAYYLLAWQWNEVTGETKMKLCSGELPQRNLLPATTTVGERANAAIIDQHAGGGTLSHAAIDADLATVKSLSDLGEAGFVDGGPHWQVATTDANADVLFCFIVPRAGSYKFRLKAATTKNGSETVNGNTIYYLMPPGSVARTTGNEAMNLALVSAAAYYFNEFTATTAITVAVANSYVIVYWQKTDGGPGGGNTMLIAKAAELVRQ